MGTAGTLNKARDDELAAAPPPLQPKLAQDIGESRWQFPSAIHNSEKTRTKTDFGPFRERRTA